MGLHENILRKPVSELSLRTAIRVSAHTSVLDAVETMRAEKLGCVIVVDGEGRPGGIFTEAALIKLLAEGRDVGHERVGAHISPAWACVKKSDPISRVVREMESKNLRFLCVTDDDGRVVALTGQKGLMEYIAEHFPRQVQRPVRRVGARSYDEDREGP